MNYNIPGYRTVQRKSVTLYGVVCLRGYLVVKELNIRQPKVIQVQRYSFSTRWIQGKYDYVFWTKRVWVSDVYSPCSKKISLQLDDFGVPAVHLFTSCIQLLLEDTFSLNTDIYTSFQDPNQCRAFSIARLGYLLLSLLFYPQNCKCSIIQGNQSGHQKKNSDWLFWLPVLWIVLLVLLKEAVSM